MMKLELTENQTVDVRFYEVDSLEIVWHGHYAKYFELGREAFGAKHGLDYLSMKKNGLKLPVVELHIEYKQPLKYGDQMIVTTKYVYTASAKLRFEYLIRNRQSGQLVASGHTVQVFVEEETDEMLLYYPDMMKSWIDVNKSKTDQ